MKAKRTKIKTIELPIEEFVYALSEEEKLALLQNIVDDFGGLEIVFKSNHGSTYIENNAFIMEGRYITIGDSGLEIKAD